MLQFIGREALSTFRIDKLLSKIQSSIPDVLSLSAHYHYIVYTERTLADQQVSRLQALLEAEVAQYTSEAEGLVALVVPRAGTISPWSSKATDIAHHCDLHSVVRIERGIRYQFETSALLESKQEQQLHRLIHDPLIEMVLNDERDAEVLFAEQPPKPVKVFDLTGDGVQKLDQANAQFAFALSQDEIIYLNDSFNEVERSPRDVELMMFAQINSEHCRHKVFRADWRIDGKAQSKSLFDMIKLTHEYYSEGVLSAYKDNAAVLEGTTGGRFFSDPHGRIYQYHEEPIHYVLKVETHNHPTAISPFPGAATGAGGEIRDEGATGLGAKPKAGLVGFSVSQLRIPEFGQPWELPESKSPNIASPLEIMLEGPIGAASFNNEFGRPNLLGYFRSFECQGLHDNDAHRRGYHKPIMLAGGLGNIRESHVNKHHLNEGAQLIVLGGPAMRIGLGGGASSSRMQGVSNTELDFASVQRGNAEIQRRAQEVIDACCALGEHNPILSIHDVGAGGLSNALPEIVHDCARGARVELRAIPNDEPGMSPLEIWCNEAQERYVLAVLPQDMELFAGICERERAPFAVVGEVTNEQHLIVGDAHFDNSPVDLPMSLLFGKAPKMLRDTHHVTFTKPDFKEQVDITEAAFRVWRHPTVADKTFLISIGDRSVGGLTARDQMVGPWQVPVADCCVTSASFNGNAGEAMAIGERTPVALLHASASARLALGEAILNLQSADVQAISEIKLSANWMADVNHPGEDAALYDAVNALAKELCTKLNITIPVGKDSLSMRSVWHDEQGQTRDVVSPVSLIITAAARVRDVRRTLTPQLVNEEDTDLLLIDLGKGKQRLGASVLAQCYGSMGHHTPDLDDVTAFVQSFAALHELKQHGWVLAYHDRSDGGLITTLAEMAFAAHTGVRCQLADLGSKPCNALFNEELGYVIQIRREHRESVLKVFHSHGLSHHVHVIGSPSYDDRIAIHFGEQCVFDQPRIDCQRAWSETSYHMQRLRDNPDCAQQAYDALLLEDDAGLTPSIPFDLDERVSAPYINKGARPRMAILREQGVNGHVEMAAAMTEAGFECVDVHMSDLIDSHQNLANFRGLVACGGFSYGDVLGAGQGWAKTILYSPHLRDEFSKFFYRRDTFTLGVCNGCQMLSNIRELIPGSEDWPAFVRNHSEQYEARLVQVEIRPSPSILFDNMAGAVIPVVVAHGEGQTQWASQAQMTTLKAQRQVVMRYVDHAHNVTERYPVNPNGSKEGITGVCSKDGRVSIMMPHPERVFRTSALSWHPEDWPEQSPWLRMFENARMWIN